MESFEERGRSGSEDTELMFQDYENFPRKLYSESCFREDTLDTIMEYANHSNREATDAYFLATVLMSLTSSIAYIWVNLTVKKIWLCLQ